MEPVWQQAVATLSGALAMVLLAVAGWINSQARRDRQRAKDDDEPADG